MKSISRILLHFRAVDCHYVCRKREHVAVRFKRTAVVGTALPVPSVPAHEPAEAHEVGAARAFPVKLACTLVKHIVLSKVGQRVFLHSGTRPERVYALKPLRLVAEAAHGALGRHQIHVGEADDGQARVGIILRAYHRLHARAVEPVDGVFPFRHVVPSGLQARLVNLMGR